MAAATKIDPARTALKEADRREPSTEDVAAQLETLRADMATLMATVAALGKAKTAEAASAVTETAEDLRRRGAEQLADMRARGELALEQAADFTRNRPAEAVALAGALGFVLGLLVRRR